MDSTPIVVISGQVPNDLIGTDAFQETDMVGISRPVVKHSFLVRAASEIPNVVKKAFYIATSGRPGPVVIDVPKDTTDPNERHEYNYPAEVSLRSYKPSSDGHMGQIRNAVRALSEARRPVIYTGGGIVQGDASAELVAVARKLGYPVTNTLMGLGAFPGDDPQFLGMLGMHGTYEANCAMHHADLIFAVGARFDDRVTNNPAKFCPEARIIHVDVDAASIAKIIDVDIPIVGHCKVVLAEMLTLLETEIADTFDNADDVTVWWQRIDRWRAEHGLDHDQRERRGTDGSLLPQQVVQAVYRATGGDAYVTSDVGQHQMFAAQYYRFSEPRRWINSGGLGTMGFGLPAAMGVQFAFPDKMVVCITGEGSFMMNMQELSTCMQYSLPIKIVNLNNQALGMVKQWQDMEYGGRHSHSTYRDALPDFSQMVASFGHVGIKVTTLEELNSVVPDIFGDRYRNDLVFLDAHIDPDEHVYPMFIKGGALKDMVLGKEEPT
jgi:acetolactate synthase-1/2/3 large subunit